MTVILIILIGIIIGARTVKDFISLLVFAAWTVFVYQMGTANGKISAVTASVFDPKGDDDDDF